MQYQNWVEVKQMTERCESRLDKPTTQNILITFPLTQSPDEQLILQNNSWLQKHIRIFRLKAKLDFLLYRIPVLQTLYY